MPDFPCSHVPGKKNQIRFIKEQIEFSWKLRSFSDLKAFIFFPAGVLPCWCFLALCSWPAVHHTHHLPASASLKLKKHHTFTTDRMEGLWCEVYSCSGHMLHELSMINTLKESGQFPNKFLMICSSNRTCKAGIHISGTEYQHFNTHEKSHEI